MHPQAKKALESFMRRKEATLRDNLPLGVTPADMKLYGSCKRLADGSEVWGYRGVDFLMMGPPEFEQKQERNTVVVTVTQKVLRLPQA